MNRSRLFALVALALVPLSGCASDDVGGGTSSGAGLPPANTVPPVDFGCSADHPHALSVPTEFTLLIKACDALDGQSATIENLTNGVIAIQVEPGSVPTNFYGDGTNTNEYLLTSLATTLGNVGLDGYRLGPKAEVVAVASRYVEGGPQLRVSFEGTGSVVSMGATALAGLMSKYVTSPSEALLNNGANCLQSASDSFTSLRVGTSSDFINSMLGLTACKAAFEAIDELAGAPSDEAEQALLRGSEEIRPFWDDIARIAEELITIAR